jgi:hypothetical protein
VVLRSRHSNLDPIMIQTTHAYNYEHNERPEVKRQNLKFFLVHRPMRPRFRLRMVYRTGYECKRLFTPTAELPPVPTYHTDTLFRFYSPRWPRIIPFFPAKLS